MLAGHTVFRRNVTTFSGTRSHKWPKHALHLHPLSCPLLCSPSTHPPESRISFLHWLLVLKSQEGGCQDFPNTFLHMSTFCLYLNSNLRSLGGFLPLWPSLQSASVILLTDKTRPQDGVTLFLGWSEMFSACFARPSWSALSISPAVPGIILPSTSVCPSKLIFDPSNKQHFLLNAQIFASLSPLPGISPTQIYIILLIFIIK